MEENYDPTGITQAFRGITDAIIQKANNEQHQEDNPQVSAYINALETGNRYLFLHKFAKHMLADNPEKVSRYLRVLCTAKPWAEIAANDRRLWFFITEEVVAYLRKRGYKPHFMKDFTIQVDHPDGTMHYGDPKYKVTELWHIGH